VHSRLTPQWLSIFLEAPATESELITLLKHQVVDTDTIWKVAAQGLSRALAETVINFQPVGTFWLIYIRSFLDETLLESLDKAVNQHSERFGRHYLTTEQRIQSWENMGEFIKQLPHHLHQFVCDHPSKFSAELVNSCRQFI
jgi:hypothetical protein